MAVLVRPRSWGKTKPPPGSSVNWGHPLSQGLTVCVLANEQNGLARVLGATRDRQLTLTTGTGGWASSTRGGGLSATAAATYWTIDQLNFLHLPTTSCTVAFTKLVTGATGGGVPFGCIEPAGDASRIGGHFPFTGGGTDCYWDFGGSTGANRLGPITSPGIGDDSWVVTAGFRGMSMWQNGVLIGTQSTAVTRTNSTDNFLINGGQSSVAGAADGDVCVISYLYIWNREFSAAEVAWFTAEPYAFFNPPESRGLLFSVNAIAAGKAYPFPIPRPRNVLYRR